MKEALKREQEERNGPRKRRFVLLIHAVLLNLLLEMTKLSVCVSFRTRGVYFFSTMHRGVTFFIFLM